MASSRTFFVSRLLCLALGLLACGCAHHKANQYSYAPPLAPPVYPQAQTPTQPVAYPAGAVPGPMVGAPVAAPVMAPAYAPAYAPAAGVPAAAGVVPAMADGSCPPCNTGCEGVMPVAYDAAVQTTPCPSGP